MASLWPAAKCSQSLRSRPFAPHWEKYSGERFAKLAKITQPCLVVNGVFDNMIPVRNSYMLSEHLPQRHAVDLSRRRAWIIVSSFHKSFVKQATLFLDSESLS